MKRLLLRNIEHQKCKLNQWKKKHYNEHEIQLSYFLNNDLQSIAENTYQLQYKTKTNRMDVWHIFFIYLFFVVFLLQYFLSGRKVRLWEKGLRKPAIRGHNRNKIGSHLAFHTLSSDLPFFICWLPHQHHFLPLYSETQAIL